MSGTADHTVRLPRDFTMDRFALVGHLPPGRFVSLASHGFDARLVGGEGRVDVIRGGSLAGDQSVSIATITAQGMDVPLGPEFNETSRLIVNRIVADWGDVPELMWPWDARDDTSYLEAMNGDSSLLTRNAASVTLRLRPDNQHDFVPLWYWSARHDR